MLVESPEIHASGPNPPYAGLLQCAPCFNV
jgi:hypothetical protein